MERINNLLIYIQCFHKDNKIKHYRKSESNQIDYYEFAMYNEMKHEELECTIGYFKFNGTSINKSKYLFKVSASTIKQAMDDFINEYQYYIEQKSIIVNDLLNCTWTKHSPYDK